MTDTNELRKLLDAATPLPWIVQKDDYWDSWSVTGPAPEHVPGWQTRESEAFDDGSAQGDYRATCTCDTRDLIVAAVNGLPAMLDELDELRAFLADLREAMELIAQVNENHMPDGTWLKARDALLAKHKEKNQ